MKSFQELPAVKALRRIAQQTPNRQDTNASHTCQALGLHIDFSHQHLDEEVLGLLIELTRARGLSQAVHALMSGEKINQSKNIPALHTALRSFEQQSLIVDGKDIMADIFDSRALMCHMATSVRSGEWVGYSNKAMQHVVNIGIGGSDLGQRFCLQALKPFVSEKLHFHFISDADPNAFHNATHNLDPETTLFIIASKSFTTIETLYNAQKAMHWINHPKAHRHFIAVTADQKRASDFGIRHTIAVGEWVGGRFSLCSAMNLITAIAIGFENFSQLLQGAHAMDKHFQHTPPQHNLPVLLALVGIWNINFMHIHNLLLLVYMQQLEQFVPYIQQLDMESNGKCIDKQGKPVNYATAPIVWGGLGNRVQHSYYQLLCQGTHKFVADMISVNAFEQDLINQMCRNKIQTLTQGFTHPTQPSAYIPGGTRLNHIHLSDCTPRLIGSLSALYEHKIFVQSVLWNINPFDQPGVDSSKHLVEYVV